MIPKHLLLSASLAVLALPAHADGYKVALEIFVKGNFQRAIEVPIHFAHRQYGESKLTLKEQLNFLRHLVRLYAYKLGAPS